MTKKPSTRPLYHRLGPALAVAKDVRELRRLRLTKAPRSTLFYWKKKHLDPSFHPLTWGGSRRHKFTEETIVLISWIIWSLILINPLVRIHEMLLALRGKPWFLDVRRGWLLALFKSWKWSWKRPIFQNIVSLNQFYTHSQCSNKAKFTPANIDRYYRFMLYVISIDPSRIKYLDEAHFSSTDLMRTRAVGPIGSRIMATKSSEDSTARLTLIACTSIARNSLGPCWAAINEGANTSFSFAQAVMKMVEIGFISAGDIVILDNAKVCTVNRFYFSHSLSDSPADRSFDSYSRTF